MVSAMLARQADARLLREEGDEQQEPETWGAWLIRNKKWILTGVGVAAVGGLLYYNRDSIGELVKGEALKHPDLIATAAKAAGSKNVAKLAGDMLVKRLEQAANSSIESLEPGEHFTDVGKALVKILPGGGLVTGAGELLQMANDNQQVLATTLEVGERLGAGYVLEVVTEIAKERGGEIVVHGINAATRPLIESAGFAYDHIGSPWW
jgi:hypothetical protein